MTAAWRTQFQAVCLAILTKIAQGTPKYYGTYLNYGTGDTFIETSHAHGGPKSPLRKWNVECLDGEAMVGIRDMVDDFQRITSVWCKFAFPYKPPSNGLYPYYPNCHVRNITTESFCFDPSIPQLSLNTFMTGLYDTDYQFRIDRPDADRGGSYKCCRVPWGYYIDYMSCYYKFTHDQYWEYYDSVNQYLVYCGDGYAMTGMSKRINPWDEEYHMEWIQCCRIGYQVQSRSPMPIVRPPMLQYQSTGQGYQGWSGPRPAFDNRYFLAKFRL